MISTKSLVFFSHSLVQTGDAIAVFLLLSALPHCTLRIPHTHFAMPHGFFALIAGFASIELGGSHVLIDGCCVVHEELTNFSSRRITYSDEGKNDRDQNSPNQSILHLHHPLSIDFSA